MGLGIVVGADTAGYDCGETLTEGFSSEHVSEVVDAVVREVENTGSLNDAMTGNRTSASVHLWHTIRSPGTARVFQYRAGSSCRPACYWNRASLSAS